MWIDTAEFVSYPTVRSLIETVSSLQILFTSLTVVSYLWDLFPLSKLSGKGLWVSELLRGGADGEGVRWPKPVHLGNNVKKKRHFVK